jgi:hypothetical protein
MQRRLCSGEWQCLSYERNSEGRSKLGVPCAALPIPINVAANDFRTAVIVRPDRLAGIALPVRCIPSSSLRALGVFAVSD